MRLLQNILFLSITLLLTACSSLQINEANQALSNHFMAKTNALNTNEAVMADSMRVALKDLAKETKLSAEKETDVLNKIAFYQISATAAWQSNLLPASDYAKAGQALCEDSDNSAQMPVHCGLLAFIPIFAINDIHSLRAKSLQEEINKAGANTEQMQPLQDEAQQMFNDYRIAISAAAAAKKKVANYQLSDDAVKQIDTSLKTLACENLERMNAIFGSAGGLNLPNRALIEQSLAELSAVDGFSCGP